MNTTKQRDSTRELANEANLIIRLLGEPNELEKQLLIESIKRIYKLGKSTAIEEVIEIFE